MYVYYYELAALIFKNSIETLSTNSYNEDGQSALISDDFVAGDQNGCVNLLANASRTEATVLLYKIYQYTNK